MGGVGPFRVLGGHIHLRISGCQLPGEQGIQAVLRRPGRPVS